MQTALLAQVEGSLIGSLPDPKDDAPASDIALRFFGYAGLIFNLGATLSSVLLLLCVTSIPTAARRIYMTCSHKFPRKVFFHQQQKKNETPPAPAPPASTPLRPKFYSTITATPITPPDTDDHMSSLNRHLLRGDTEGSLLNEFGIANGWGMMLRHCIFCFLAGCVCAFVHVGIALWTREQRLVAAILMPVVFVGFVPPIYVFAFDMGTPGCKECKEEARER